MLTILAIIAGFMGTPVKPIKIIEIIATDLYSANNAITSNEALRIVNPTSIIAKLCAWAKRPVIIFPMILDKPKIIRINGTSCILKPVTSTKTGTK